MTVRQIATVSLKQLKNTVIGNPSAKLALSRDTAFIHVCVLSTRLYPESTSSIVDCLNRPPTSGEPLIPFFSLAGSEAEQNALQAIVRALSNPQALAIISLRSALARALRVLASTIIEVTGPTLGPMRIYSTQFPSEVKIVLSYLFEVRFRPWCSDHTNKWFHL